MSTQQGLLPTRREVVDGGFTVALTMLAIVGYRQAYGGSTYLLLGGLGVTLGVVLAHFTSRTRQPVFAVALVSAVAALLLGGVVLRETAVAGFLPSVATVTGLSEVVVTGWKELLTTVRPVGDAGDLLALPYLLGLVAGVAGHSLAQRVRPLAAPLLPPVGVAALSVLFGGDAPAAAFLQGCLLAALGLAWMALRRSRDRVSLVRSNQRFFRPVAALGLLAVACAGAWFGGPHLPLAQANDRTVIAVQPPFDPGAYASPLAGFRRYTENAALPLVDRTLFTVTGLGEDRTVRIATLDDYDGLVWGASNRAATTSPVAGFARIGSSLPASGRGAERTVSLTVEDGYSGDVWLPTTGVPQGLSFSGPRAAELTASLRYNLATATGIVPIGLQAGDVVRLRTRPTVRLAPEQLAIASPEGATSLPSAAYEPVRAAAVEFSGTATSPIERVLEIGKKLREGAYSDGLDAVPSDPGHGAGRLTTFVQGSQIVGDDEQYAAAMALMANAVGVPARVVLYATVPADGAVTGKNVQGGVELALAGHGWVPLETSLFTPSRDKKPEVQPKLQLPEVPPKVVPPPLRTLLSTTTSTEADTSAGRSDRDGNGGFALPGPLVAAMRWTGPPLLVVLASASLVLGLKARRRTRRRQRGPLTARVVNGWAEVLDTARDLGVTVAHGTRRQQAAALAPLSLTPLAHRADATVFGPGEPAEGDVSTFWHEVDATRRALLAGLSRRRRLQVALSLRSLVPALARPRPSSAGGRL